MGEPACTGQPLISVSTVATRLTCVTELSHRNVSSMTPGSSSRSATTRSSSVGVLEQGDERVAHHPERGLGPGREQEPQEAVDLLVGELRPVDLGGDEVADEVAARRLPAVLDDRLEVVAHRLRRRHAHGRVERTGVDLLGPLVELHAVLERDADDAADHLHRVLRGDVAHEVGPAERRDRRRAASRCGPHQLGRPSARARTPGRRGRRGCGRRGAPGRPSRG